MDGRSVIMASRPPQAEAARETGMKEQIHSEVGDVATDEEDTGQDEEDGDDSEMVLSKDDFLMLQAFHRFVPLPALSSRIVRLLCEEDLQVDEEDDDAPPESAPRSLAQEQAVIATPMPLVSGLKAVRTLSRTSLAVQSPLTKRLSTKSASRTNMLKPRREVNLAAQTPRIKRVSPSIDVNERTG